jgi:eukaryotic-like serine/threonine-protein kinase
LRTEKPNRRIMIGAVAVLALLAIVIPVVLSGFRGEPQSSPAGTSTSDVQEPSPSEPMQATTTPAVPVSNEDPDALEFTDSKGIAMRLVSAGNFIMGNSDSQYSEEKPTHTVYLDDFYIDRYEVTNVMYKACVDTGACQPPDQTTSSTRDSYYGNTEYDNFPVIFVGWEDANAYCQWRGMKLPSEAQWEKAARGPDGRTYPWGENIDDTYANYNDSAGDTTEVGSYEKGKSPYGLYDMAGNAWEWVADWFSSSYYLDTPLTNPPGPVSGDYRVLRGGSWHNQAETVATSSRGWNQLEFFENTDFGFRCAMDGQP